jgi:hypothetical protein
MPPQLVGVADVLVREEPHQRALPSTTPTARNRPGVKGSAMSALRR